MISSMAKLIVADQRAHLATKQGSERMSGNSWRCACDAGKRPLDMAPVIASDLPPEQMHVTKLGRRTRHVAVTVLAFVHVLFMIAP